MNLLSLWLEKSALKVESTFKSRGVLEVDSTSPVNWDILGTTGPIGLKFCVHLDFAVL